MKKRCFAAVIFMLFVICMPALATETVTVQGDGVVYLDADQATFYVGVSETAEDVMIVQNAVNERIDSIIATFEKIGVEKKNMATNAINIYPVYDYTETGDRITGYTAHNSLCIQTDQIDKVGEYIDAAFAAGANTLDSVNFSAKDTSEASKQALRLAVKAAKDKAEVLAEAAGMQLGDVEQITEQSAYSYGNGMFRYTEAASEDKAAGTQVLTSQFEVCASVSVTYCMLPLE